MAQGTSQYSTFSQSSFLIGVRKSGNLVDNKYFNSVDTFENYKPNKGGSISRRDGTERLGNFLTGFRNKGTPKFFSEFFEGHVCLFEDSTFWYVRNGITTRLNLNYFRSDRYVRNDNVLNKVESIEYDISNLYDKLDTIKTIAHEQVRDIKKRGKGFLITPSRGVPYNLYERDNLVILEPYFFNERELKSVDSIIRSYPIDPQKVSFQDVFYDSGGNPINTPVSLFLGQESDLDNFECKAWLGADGTVPTKVKIAKDKMNLRDYIGVPFIFTVLPENPVPIPFEYRTEIVSDEEEIPTYNTAIQAVAGSDWNNDKSYTDGLLGNLDKAGAVQTFSYTSSSDSVGNITSSKAQLIRELLYGRRYMIIPYEVGQDTNNIPPIQNGLVNYRDVFATTNVLTQAQTNADIGIKSGLASTDITYDTPADGFKVNVENLQSDVQSEFTELETTTGIEARFDTTYIYADNSRFPRNYWRILGYFADENWNAAYFWSESTASRRGGYRNTDSGSKLRYNNDGTFNANAGVDNGIFVNNVKNNDLSKLCAFQIEFDYYNEGSSTYRLTVDDLSLQLDAPFYLKVDEANPEITYVIKLMDDTGTVIQSFNDVNTLTSISYVNGYAEFNRLAFRASNNYPTSRFVESDNASAISARFNDGCKISISIYYKNRIQNIYFSNTRTDAFRAGGLANDRAQAVTTYGYKNPSDQEGILLDTVIPNNGSVDFARRIKSGSVYDTKLIGMYVDIPRQNGVLSYDDATFDIALTSTDLNTISKVKLTLDNDSEILFASTTDKSTPSGSGAIRSFELDAGQNSSLLERLVEDESYGTVFFKTEFLNSSDKVITIPIESEITPDNLLYYGYNKTSGSNFIYDISDSNNYTKLTTNNSSGTSVEPNKNDVIKAFGVHAVLKDSVKKFSWFIQVDANATIASQTNLRIKYGSSTILLTKNTVTTISGVQEFLMANSSGAIDFDVMLTSIPDFPANNILKDVEILLGSSGTTKYVFADAITQATEAKFYANCILFEIGMPSPAKSGSTKRVIGGNNFATTGADTALRYGVSKVNTVYRGKEDFEGATVLGENFAVYKGNTLNFIYGSEARANNVHQVINGAPSDEIKDLALRAEYVPSNFNGTPAVIASYIRTNETLADNIPNSPQFLTIDDYLEGRRTRDNVLYFREIVDPQGGTINIKNIISNFEGKSIIAVSDEGTFVVPIVGDITLINKYNILFEPIVLNSKFIYFTADELIAFQLGSEERRGLRTIFGGGEQKGLFANLTSGIYHNKDQLYLMTNGDGEIIHALDYDTDLGGFGKWKSDVFKFRKLFSNGVELFAYAEHSSGVPSIVKFVKTHTDYGSKYTSKIVSHPFVSSRTVESIGLFSGFMKRIHVSYEQDSFGDEISINLRCDNSQIVELKLSQGESICATEAPPHGFNPRLEIVQNGAGMVNTIIYNYRTVGQLDGIL